MRFPGDLKIEDFSYDLPKERIAQHPLNERDKSKIIVSSAESLFESTFQDLPGLLPGDSVLFLNETKVVQARLLFNKVTGAGIEIFLLDPVYPHTDFQLSLRSTSPCQWNCLVGNRKRWKGETLMLKSGIDDDGIQLFARIISSNAELNIIELSWAPDKLTFSTILETFGQTPLPPYIERRASEADKHTYQTLYARAEGSVAAPTAGLHFTDRIFQGLSKKGIDIHKVTLHVGIGTFKPVTASALTDHEMHSEQVDIPLVTIEALSNSLNKTKVMVGTTTTRVIESIYWQGVKWMSQSAVGSRQSMPPMLSMDIQQWDPYELPNDIPVAESLDYIIIRLKEAGLDALRGSTQLLIAPGYEFKLTDALVTNFHMSQSTLLLLIAALMGERWRDAYRYALTHDFRFLSYGDACLFFKTEM